jgi:desampylase
MAIRIAIQLSEVLIGLAAASPKEEICGLLFGDCEQVRDIEPVANVSRKPETRFEIDPAALIAAHRRVRGGATALLGYYHSHPNGAALPSAEDALQAAPDGAIWLIIAASELKAWRAVADGAVYGRFDPVAILPC